MIATPVAAATLCLLRPRATRFDVLMMRRRMGGTFSGQHVFPGGVVDPEDDQVERFDSDAVARRMEGRKRFEQVFSPTAHWVAALRETFEEAGILLAYDRQGEFVAERTGIYSAERDAINKREMSFREFLEQRELTLALDRVAYMTRKITPTFVPRRFDTHFFVVEVPASTQGSPCEHELESGFWIDPQTALERANSDLPMVHPTLMALKALSEFNHAHEAVDFYREQWA